MTFMKYESVFTEIDKSINADHSFDPLGLMVIWRSYAQEVFRGKITTVAKDMRHFAINLFNLSVIRKILCSAEGQALIHGEYTEDQFFSDLLVMMENIFIYSFKDDSTPPVTGVTKYRKTPERFPHLIGFRKWEGRNNQKYHILSRQLQLGISGRYKTSFKSMELDYEKLKGKEWESAEKIVHSCFGNLQDQIIAFFMEIKSKEEISFSQLGEMKIDKGIQKAFNIEEKLPVEVDSFFMEKLGLTEGAAGAIYDGIKSLISSNPERKVDHRELFNSIKGKLQEEELEKIDNILDLESFLAPIQFFFDALIQTSRDEISLYDSLWEKIGEKCGKGSCDGVGLVGTAKSRFEHLQRFVAERNITRNLIEYHTKVQDERHSVPWISIENERIKRAEWRRIKTINEWKKDTIDKETCWKNDYYVSSIVYLALSQSSGHGT